MLCLNMMMFSQAPANYTMVWNDEFNGSTLDATKWKPAPEWNRQGGSYWSDENYEMTGSGQVKLITSERNDTVFCGAIRTHNLFDQKYGYFEVRCKVPQIRGGWTAFWMMPYGNQPGDDGNDGTEIDIFESINGWNNKIQHALHWDGYGVEHQKASQSFIRSDIYDDAYHTFGMKWTATEYTFYIDGVQTWQTSAGGVSDVNQYLKLTMEVSSDTWPGDWNDQVTKPIDWLIDYVRVYEYDPTTYYVLEIGASDYGKVTKSPDQVSYSDGQLLTLTPVPDNGYVFNNWYGTVESATTSLALTMNADHEQTPEIIRTGEMIQNTQFLNEATSWYGKGATMSVTDGVYLTEIPSVTTNVWDVQLTQGGLVVEDGEIYTVTVKASATQDRTIRVVLGLGEAPYTAYGATDISLTTTPQFFSFDVPVSVNESNARVAINLGQYMGDVMLEEVSVVKKETILSADEVVASNLSVFPNPAEGPFSIVSDKPWGRLGVLGLDGTEFYATTEFQEEKTVDVALAKGVYLVKIQYQNGLKQQILVVH